MTSTTEITSARYKVEIVDVDYYQRQIPCQDACPVHTDAQGYVNAIERGDYEKGYIIASQPNPFASVCGRVCASPCERACRRRNIDASVTIRTLKRFLCERYGVGNRRLLSFTRAFIEGRGVEYLTGRAPGNSNTAESVASILKAAAKRGSGKKSLRVAIIGSGPTGLTAARDLTIAGYKVTVFEAASEAGGMALLGIPEHRLPHNVIKLEINEILDLGVELKVNTRLGIDFSLASLREQGFGAILIAIGAYKDKWLEIEGTDLNGVRAAVDFLMSVKQGHHVNLGDKVAVIGGGGNEERTRKPKGADEIAADNTLMTVMDAAQQALRSGVSEVHVFYRGTMEEMRASQSMEELDNALEEGIIVHTNAIPKRIIGSHGKVTGFETLVSRSQSDEKGQSTLVPVTGSESTIKCSSVILAIGQESDLSFIHSRDNIAFSNQGAIIADTETLATSAPGIFAGGDAVSGPRTVIDAIADGHRAAGAINNYLRGVKARIARNNWIVPVAYDNLPEPDSLNTPRANPPRVPLESRSGLTEVEGVFDETSAREQAGRCLKCNIQTIFNAELCILCGGCVDVCPQYCYKMVSLDNIEGDQKIEAMVESAYGIPLSAFQKGSEVLAQGTAMIKDETRCVRCGLCAKRCPTGAITMKEFQFEEELVGDEKALESLQVTVVGR